MISTNVHNTLLEQGRALHPSREVLQSIAEALHLTPDERHHLFVLAEGTPLVETYTSNDQVGPALRRVLGALDPLPAYVIGRRWDFLAWNTSAERVLLLSQSVPPYEQNAIWRMFANPLAQQLYHPKWEQEAQKVLAVFRAESAQAADEAWFKRLIADLHQVSQEFRAWWPQHEVRWRADARKDIEHPVVGCLRFEQTSLQVPTQPELKLMIYTPLPETDTLEKLQQLMDEQGARPQKAATPQA